MKRYIHLAPLAAAALFAGLMIWSSPAEAQAPAGAKGKLPGKGAPKQEGMENGLTYFQARCMSCHSERTTTAPTARRIREMSPEQIYAVVSTRRGRSMTRG
jgi:cytochrome c5